MRTSPLKHLILAALSSTVALAQVASDSAPRTGDNDSSVKAPPTGALATAAPAQDETDLIVLSPFEVSSSSDKGYASTETTAGSRFRTDYRDVSSQLTVMTAEFLQDMGAASLEDTFKFTLNVDAESSFFNSVGGSGTQTGNPFSPDSGNRIRGLGKLSTTHDFFETTVSLDTYNTERINYVSGPNAILFGNGLAGGSVEMPFKRAKINKDTYKFSMRLNDTGGHREEIDANKVIIKNKLAVRVAAMHKDEDNYRTPSFDKQDRRFFALTYEPFSFVKIRGYFEDAKISRQPVRPTLIQDKVSPYLSTLTPEAREAYIKRGDISGLRAFDNSAYNSYNIVFSPINNTEAGKTNNPLNNAFNAGLVAQGFATYQPGSTTALNTNALATRNSLVQGVLVLNSATPLPIQSWNNTLIFGNTLGQYAYGDRNDWSLSDSSIYPYELNITGNGLRNSDKSKIKGVNIELNPLKGLYVEYANNFETYNRSFVEYLNYNSSELNIDINKYLPVSVPFQAPTTGAVTVPTLPTRILNPNFGRYYVTNTNGGFGIGDVENLREDHRVTASYELNLKNKFGNLGKWLGVHRVLGMWTSQMNQRLSSGITGANGLRVTSNNNFTEVKTVNGNTVTGTVGGVLDNFEASRMLVMRHYLDNPNVTPGGTTTINLPFDPYNPGVVGIDSTGKDVTLSSLNLEKGATTAFTNGTKKTKSWMFADQSSILKDLVIVNFGLRKDSTTYTPYKGSARMPRWDNATQSWVIPESDVPASNAASSPVSTSPYFYLRNAPYLDWRTARDQFDESVYTDYAKAINEKAQSRLTGIVVHPLKWLSLTYNDSSSAYAAEFVRYNLDGSSAQIDDGTGKDYGIKLNLFSNKLFLGVNWYENSRLGTLSSYRDNSGNGLKSIRDSIYHMEKTYMTVNPGYMVPADSSYAEYMNKVKDSSINVLSNTNFTGGNVPNSPIRDLGYDVFSRKLAKGVEIQLTANPTPALTLMATLARNNTTESNIANNWVEYIRDRLPDWNTLDPQMPMYNVVGQPTTVLSYYQNVIAPSLIYLNNVEGQPNPQERPYRANVSGRYSFLKGSLKGLKVGGSYQYRSKVALGNYTRAASSEDLAYLNENGLNFPGIGVGTFLVADTARFIYGDAQHNFDAFIGYTRKFGSGKFAWTIQLNISNFLNNTKLQPQRAYVYSDPVAGERVLLTNFNSPPPRQFILTNTIEF